MRQVLIVGFGDIGARVARQCDTMPIRALARCAESAQRQREMGVIPVSGDLDDPTSLRLPALTDTGIFYFAPPPDVGVVDTRMNNFLAALRDRPPEKIVYISTTGVYGDCKGGWVTEQSPPNPGTDRARRRLSAEQALRIYEDEHDVPVVILRVPGIYGPGRLPIESIRSGRSILSPEQAPFSNRIHADDLVTICWAAMRHGTRGALYNVSDGQVGTMSDYFLAVAQHLGLPAPPVIDWAQAQKSLSPGMLSYLAESRRIDNRKMLNELKVVLQYPDLASGLAACG